MYSKAKRLLDLSCSALALAALSPVMATAAAAVRVSMGSPVFFRQQRPGLGGAPFELVKFRTMRAPTANEEMFKTDAQRLTRVGRFLRSTSIDELPTLWNVVKGDMSLVGPRPLLMQYLERYTPEQARRHEVKPGITGLAQVRGRNSLSWEEKFALDVWYVDNRSFLLDLKILGLTVYKVATREGVNHPGQATMTEFLGSRAQSQER